MSADVLELTVRLGARFIDAATGATVATGLTVSAGPPSRDRRVAAVRTPGGTYAIHDAPAGPLELRVQDSERRFLPSRFTATAPAGTLIASPCGPDVAAGPGVPLFSAPERSSPPGVASVRAHLWDADAGRPAAWALVSVQAPGSTGRGVAGASGEVLVCLPWPAVQTGLGGGGAPVSLAGQAWPLTLTVRYSGTAGAGAAPGRGPDVCAVLGQPLAALLDDDDPSTPLPAPTLAYGRELVVHSSGRSELLVTHAP